MELLNIFTVIESFFNKFGIAFTILVMYQGLFGGMVISTPPKVLKRMTQNTIFKIFTLFCVAFTATKDVELALVSTCVFLLILHLMRTPEEKKKVGYSII